MYLTITHAITRAITSKIILGLGVFAITVLSQPLCSQALPKIREITSQRKIAIWLVEDYKSPIIAVRFGWHGGLTTEADDKTGISNITTQLLGQGAGDYGRNDFFSKLALTGTQFFVNANYDTIDGTFSILRHNRTEAIALIRAAITKPHFDDTALDWLKAQLLGALEEEKTNPTTIAERQWFNTAFENHPYGRNRLGHPESINNITADDLKDWHKKHFARDNLVVAISGAISAQEAIAMVDEIFGNLPAKHKLPKPENYTIPSHAKIQFIKRDNPQTTIFFGHGGVHRDDPEFYTAYIMNYILGGGQVSNLMQSVRHDRGLTYSIGSTFIPFQHTTAWYGQYATDNKNVQETIDLVRQAMRNLRTKNVSEKKLNNAKTNLIGSYALRFDSNLAIAEQLFRVQWVGLSTNHFNTRDDKINTVSIKDIAKQAKRLLHPDRLIISGVGGGETPK